MKEAMPWVVRREDEEKLEGLGLEVVGVQMVIMAWHSGGGLARCGCGSGCSARKEAVVMPQRLLTARRNKEGSPGVWMRARGCRSGAHAVDGGGALGRPVWAVSRPVLQGKGAQMLGWSFAVVKAAMVLEGRRCGGGKGLSWGERPGVPKAVQKKVRRPSSWLWSLGLAEELWALVFCRGLLRHGEVRGRSKEEKAEDECAVGEWRYAGVAPGVRAPGKGRRL